LVADFLCLLLVDLMCDKNFDQEVAIRCLYDEVRNNFMEPLFNADVRIPQ